MSSPALGDWGGHPPQSLMDDTEIIAKARKAAYAMARRHRFAQGVYEVDDLIQDGCVALLQGRSAWYGVCDGLRKWLHRRRWWTEVSIAKAGRCTYTPDPLREIIVEERLRQAMRRMDRWRHKKQTTWWLYHGEDKTQEQIGLILGVSQGRVSQWLSTT